MDEDIFGEATVPHGRETHEQEIAKIFLDPDDLLGTVGLRPDDLPVPDHQALDIGMTRRALDPRRAVGRFDFCDLRLGATRRHERKAEHGRQDLSHACFSNRLPLSILRRLAHCRKPLSSTSGNIERALPRGHNTAQGNAT
ncbi:hypothetical protein [Paracoccus niistensis]|uniref:Uncharacterized protein n=1 Tax=Paracoccus niistensis TaxID=632935 RepID=A0ABV6HZD5_9RHOB